MTKSCPGPGSPDADDDDDDDDDDDASLDSPGGADNAVGAGAPGNAAAAAGVDDLEAAFEDPPLSRVEVALALALELSSAAAELSCT